MERRSLGRLLLAVLVTTAVVALTSIGWALDPPTTSGPAPAEGGSAFNLGMLVPLFMAAAPMLLAALKAMAPSIPKAWLPFAMPFLGFVGEVLAHLALSTPMGGWGPIAAMAGTNIREMVDQYRKNGLGPSGERVGDTSGALRPPS